MNDERDEEIQTWLEEHHRRGEARSESVSEPEALALYRQIFDELSTEPPVGLSYGFSARVVRQIQQKEVARKERRAYGLLGLCLLLMPLVALGLQAFFRLEDLGQTVRALNAVKVPALFGGLLLVLIQWADRRFVKRKMNS